MEWMMRAWMLAVLLAATATGAQKAAAAQRGQFLRRRRYQINYLRPLCSSAKRLQKPHHRFTHLLSSFELAFRISSKRVGRNRVRVPYQRRGETAGQLYKFHGVNS